MYAPYTKSYTTEHIGAHNRKYRCRQIHKEVTPNQSIVPASFMGLFTGQITYNVFALQDITDINEKFAYPRGKTDEAIAGRMQFHERYGKRHVSVLIHLIKTRQSQMKAQASIPNVEKRFFKIVASLCAIIKIHIESFGLGADLSENLMITKYAKTFQYEQELLQAKFNNPYYYPRQEKVRRASDVLRQIIVEYRNVCDEYLSTRPNLIYQLSPIVFAKYMEKYASDELVQYGVRQARNGWMSISIGSIIQPFHERHLKGLWVTILLRICPLESTQLPSDVCALIADYLVDVKIGESFSTYMERVYDNVDHWVKPQYAHLCKITGTRSYVSNATRTIHEVVNVEMMQYTV